MAHLPACLPAYYYLLLTVQRIGVALLRDAPCLRFVSPTVFLTHPRLTTHCVRPVAAAR